MQLILLIGIPGSGKSTFYVQQFFHTHVRVNLDLLRTRNRENRLLQFCFETQQRAVVDNTNVSIKDRKKYIDLAKLNRFRITGYYFATNLQVCLQRNAGRTGRQRIDDRGVVAKYRLLQVPAVDEGFDELYYVQLNEKQEFVVTPWMNEA
jgi:predicted kinase